MLLLVVVFMITKSTFSKGVSFLPKEAISSKRVWAPYEQMHRPCPQVTQENAQGNQKDGIHDNFRATTKVSTSNF
jgi:hypothetical protein